MIEMKGYFHLSLDHVIRYFLKMIINWFKRFPVRIAIARLFYKYDSEFDNWKNSYVKFSPYELGYKIRMDMSLYFKGDSKIKISDIKELCDWLIDCQYERVINVRDWKHPLVFEEEKIGDCFDHALWAWRKLTELGIDTEFMVGEIIADGVHKQHAWVVFERNQDHKMLIETVSKDKERMLYYLSAVEHLYVPWASVDSNFRYRLYGGYCSAIKRKK